MPYLHQNYIINTLYLVFFTTHWAFVQILYIKWKGCGVGGGDGEQIYSYRKQWCWGGGTVLSNCIEEAVQFFFSLSQCAG